MVHIQGKPTLSFYYSFFWFCLRILLQISVIMTHEFAYNFYDSIPYFCANSSWYFLVSQYLSKTDSGRDWSLEILFSSLPSLISTSWRCRPFRYFGIEYPPLNKTTVNKTSCFLGLLRFGRDSFRYYTQASWRTSVNKNNRFLELNRPGPKAVLLSGGYCTFCFRVFVKKFVASWSSL